MAALSGPTYIPFYSPTRNAMYVIVKPAPNNRCYEDEHVSAGAAEGLFSPPDSSFFARDSLSLVRTRQMKGEEKKSDGGWLRKFVKGVCRRQAVRVVCVKRLA
jgi:hypothetical protein